MLALSHLVASRKYGKRLRTIGKSRVAYIDGNPLNLIDSNVDWCRDRNKDKTAINTFEIVGDKFIITHNSSGVKAYTNIDNELIEILKSKRWYSCLGRLTTPYKESRMDLSHFVLAYFSNQKIGELKRQISRGYCVDHIDDNPSNNQKWNLSIMKALENKLKRSFVSNIVLPFVFNAIYFDGKYRAVMSHVHWQEESSTGKEIAFYSDIFEFDSAEQFIMYLRYWYENYTYNGLTPKDNYEMKKANGEKLVRYELRESDYERLRDATNVVSDLPLCGHISKKGLFDMVDRSPPEVQEQMKELLTHVKIPGSMPGFMFVSPLERKD
jgi:hypothetical protein